MVEFNIIEPKFRSRFKKLISSRRSHTSENQSQTNNHQTLAELSEKSLSQQKNKKIHNMSKESYITSKKQFLLSRKIFYKPKPQDTKLIEIENLRKFNKANTFENLMENTIQQEDVFNIQKQILNNPLNFHRNMIIKVKDDEQIKGILRQWYKTNVSHERNKLRSISQNNKPYFRMDSQRNKNKQINESEHKKSPSIINRKRMDVLKDQSLRKHKSNQKPFPRDYSNFEQEEPKEKNTENLVKLILRLQPFWDKVRIKI